MPIKLACSTLSPGQSTQVPTHPLLSSTFSVSLHSPQPRELAELSLPYLGAGRVGYWCKEASSCPCTSLSFSEVATNKLYSGVATTLGWHKSTLDCILRWSIQDQGKLFPLSLCLGSCYPLLSTQPLYDFRAHSSREHCK